MRSASIRPNDFKMLSLVFFVLAAAGVVGPILIYYQYVTKKTPVEQGQGPIVRPPRHFQQIRGFRYDGSFQGKRGLSIEADRLRIQKKKLGYFRFNLLKEAELDNARVHIYARNHDRGHDGTTQAAVASADSPVRNESSETPAFERIFSPENLPSLPVKRISAIVMRPVSMTFHHGKGEATRIEAAEGTIRLSNRDILFAGNVRVDAGPRDGSRTLTADRLKVVPGKAILISEGPYTLNSTAGRLHGRSLTTDMFLDPVYAGHSGGGTSGRRGPASKGNEP